MSDREFEGHVHCTRCGDVVTEGIGAILGDRKIGLCAEQYPEHEDALRKQGWSVVIVEGETP